MAIVDVEAALVLERTRVLEEEMEVGAIVSTIVLAGAV